MNNKKLIYKGYFYVIISAVLFGTMPLMAKYIYAEGLNSLSLVLVRNCISVPILAFLSGIGRRPDKILAKDMAYIALIAVAGCSLTPLLLFSSYRYMDTGTATVFHFVYPAVVVILSVVFLKKRINLTTALSLVICIAGICLFYSPGNPVDITGSILAFASGVTYAIYVTLIACFKRKDLSGWTLSFYIAVFSSVAMLLACMASGMLVFPHTLYGWLLCIVFAVAINVGAVVLFQNGTRIIGGEKAAILSAFEPITSVLAGSVVFNEVITLRTGIGSVMVIAAGVIIALCKNDN